eukprot:6183313-Pleurochrysis_carterae.AAC.6
MAKVNFHLTSIYDHSVFEAFSKIVGGRSSRDRLLRRDRSHRVFSVRAIPSACGTHTLGGARTPPHVCLSDIARGLALLSPWWSVQVVQQLIPQLPTLEMLLDTLVTSCRIEKAFLFDVISKIYIATDSSPVDMQSYELCADMIDVVIDVSSIYAAEREEEGEARAGAPATNSNCVITLNNGTALFLREVNRSLALVCILKDSVLQQQGLLEYNCACFRDSLFDLFRCSTVAS